jgi:S-DNA-T family DNA segregation ATPase FtsK/SpoIIIE
VIGLEIPNRHREIVYLREVLEAPVYTQSSATLTLALGKDIGGNPVVANLAKDAAPAGGRHHRFR